MSRSYDKREIVGAAAAVLVALAVRVIPAYPLVYGRGGGVRLLGADSYFHMRTVDNLLAHFPFRSGFDPYMVFPGGQNVPTGPFLDWLIAGIAWALGLGAPSEALVDHVGAWTPAVMGAAAAGVVWALGRMLFSPGAGVAAAWFAALAPGLFYEVSRLGFPDHHAAELLLYASTWAALTAALSAETTRGRDGAAVLAGLLLGAFLLNRPAGVFLAGLLAVWAALEFWHRFHWGRSVGDLWRVMAIVLVLATALFVPGGGMIWSEITLLGLVGALAGVSACAGLAVALSRKGAPWWTFPVGLAVLGLMGLAGAAVAAPEAVAGLRTVYLRIVMAETSRTVREMYPFLLDPMTSGYSWRPGFNAFGVAFFLFPFVATKVGWDALGEEGGAGRRLLFVLSCGFLLFTLLQNRMAAYLAINVALAAGWVVWRCAAAFEGRWARTAAVAAIVAAIYLPLPGLVAQAARLDTGPSEDWRKTLRWLREETPEPLGSSDAYFALHAPRDGGDPFAYPASAYSVMAWWDYGWWIERSARRIPAANGTQAGAREAARFYLETDPAEAIKRLDERGSRYVLTDPMLPLWAAEQLTPYNGKMRSMLPWAEEELSRYATYYLHVEKGRVRPLIVFSPEYYRTMAARLYVFDGEAYEPSQSTWAISYDERKGRGGQTYRRISSMRAFETYEKAVRYIEIRPDQNLVLGGLDPTRSCVPLEAVEGLEMVYRSSRERPGIDAPRAVKVFERTGGER